MLLTSRTGLYRDIHRPGLAVIAVVYDILYRRIRPLPATRVELYHKVWQDALSALNGSNQDSAQVAQTVLPAMAYWCMRPETRTIHEPDLPGILQRLKRDSVQKGTTTDLMGVLRKLATIQVPSPLIPARILLLSPEWGHRFSGCLVRGSA